jgi:hypothetical protein
MNKNPGAEDKFKQISAAYEHLCRYYLMRRRDLPMIGSARLV